MYSEPLAEANMDYPVRVATKLKSVSRNDVKACESLASRNKIRRC